MKSSLLRLARSQRRVLARLRFPDPVEFIYNPLEYAWTPHRIYLERFGTARKAVVLVGMNPGPWGMAQTGVPFGEVEFVRDWMGVSGIVGTPPLEHPRVRVQGFNCRRSEVSGRRLWGWAKSAFRTPQRFFTRFFVVNYCPLMFLDRQGRNLTPDKLPAAQREPLLAVCDDALARILDALEPRFVVGVGGFAEARIRAVVGDSNLTVGRILHPSPASPMANRGWQARAVEQMRALGIEVE